MVLDVVIKSHDFLIIGGVCLVYHLSYRFGETPFKRSIESPSAWKSPWFLNSFIPGPRIDTEITIEVIEVLKMQILHYMLESVYVSNQLLGISPGYRRFYEPR